MTGKSGTIPVLPVDSYTYMQYRVWLKSLSFVLTAIPPELFPSGTRLDENSLLHVIRATLFGSH